jgi:hypothetical protein
MTRRAIGVAALFAAASCRSDAPRDVPRSPGDTSAARVAAADTIDGCRQTRGTRPDTSIALGSDAAERWARSLARGAEYRCVITPSTMMRFVIVGDTIIPGFDSILVYASAPDAKPVQVLSLQAQMGEMPAPFIPNLLQAVDLDADGYRDLMMGTSWGATGNTAYAVWRYDPRARRFAADTALSSMFNPSPVPGRACVTSYSNSSARDDGTGLFCLRDGRWMLDSADEHEWDRQANAVIHTIRVRRGDSLVVLERETLPDST